MVAGEVHIEWAGREDGAMVVYAWYMSKVTASDDGRCAYVHLEFSGVEAVRYSTEMVFFGDETGMRETAKAEPWLTLFGQAPTPQGPYVLYQSLQTPLLESMSGPDWDPDGMVHFELPRSHEGYLDVLARGVEVHEMVLSEAPGSRADVLKGKEVWHDTFPG